MPNNPPAVIGVGGLRQLLRTAPPPALFPRSLPGKQPTGPPGSLASPPGWPSRLAGQPGPARLGQLAELVWDHFGVQNGIVGHQIVNL